MMAKGSEDKAPWPKRGGVEKKKGTMDEEDWDGKGSMFLCGEVVHRSG
jgi:hypothetical protein